MQIDVNRILIADINQIVVDCEHGTVQNIVQCLDWMETAVARHLSGCVRLHVFVLPVFEAERTRQSFSTLELEFGIY